MATRTQTCVIRMLDCNNARDREMFRYLQGLAALQKMHFVDIFPWETECDAESRHLMFVSLTYSYPSAQTRHLLSMQDMPGVQVGLPTKICGWMTVQVKSRRYMYIPTLSTRTPTDPTFAGVGKALLDAVHEHALKTGMDFVYLMPLQNVIKFYQKQGYKHVHDSVPYMAKTLRKGRSPTAQIVNAWVAYKEKQAKELTDEYAFAELTKDLDPKDRKLVLKLVAEDPSRIYEVLAVVEESSSVDDLREWIKSYSDPSP